MAGQRVVSQTADGSAHAPSRFWRARLGAALLLGALALAPAACTSFQRAPQVTVPVQESAAKQYAYAVKYRGEKNLALIREDKRFEKARLVVYQTFGKVVEHFPEDRTFTALAKLEMIEMDAGLDHQRVKVSKGQVHRAIRELRQLAKAYPEFDYIQAKTLYDQGLCHKRLGEYPQAQECFKQVRDRFAKHKNQDIANLAQRASVFYNQTYEQD